MGSWFSTLRHSGSSPSASGSESVSQTVRVVRIEKCGCAEFDCDYDFHAAIETLHVELENGNAVAVSYTWGNFNREDRLVGHKKDDPTAAVRMNLAEEWVFPDFIDRLIEISDFRGAVWIDQLCNPAKDEDLNTLLAKIPDIYRTLDVKVLMPGIVCRCFAEKGHPLVHGGPGEFKKLFPGALGCHNMIGMSSYASRIWTRQEFLYAQNVQVTWNFKTYAECVPLPLPIINGKIDESVIEKMNPYTKMLYNQLMESNTDLHRIDLGLSLPMLDYFRALFNCFTESRMYHVNDAHSYSEHTAKLLTMFLLGYRVEKPPPVWQAVRAANLEAGAPKEVADYNEEMLKLWRFTNTTAMLGQSIRNATESKDYVLSVFVDMPRYIIPAERKIMKPLELLEDAIAQMENKWNATMPTRAPAGLFNKLPSVSWRPSLHLSKDHFQTAAEVYSSLPASAKPLHFIAGRAPLKRFVADSRSITKRSSLYSDSFSREDMGMVFSICWKIMSNWPHLFSDRLYKLERDMFDSTLRSAVERFYVSLQTEFKYEEGLPFSEDLFVQCLLIHHLRLGRMTNRERVWTNMRCIDHHDTLYRVTSFMLGLDYKICQNHGLKLIIAMDEPVCLGLIAKSFPRHRQPDAATDEVSSKDNYLTVSTCWTQETSDVSLGDCLLETCEDSMRDSSTEQPCYRVIGSWLPLLRADMTDIGAGIFDRENSEEWGQSKRCDGWLI